jgi:16S rRNA (adenine1518-N6/adenine1519-N6)-dimethyltransferase
LEKIVKAGEIALGETVLEIGPGDGALTQKLLDSGATVLAVEKDLRLIPILEQKFNTEIKIGKLKLINDDILKIDLFSEHLLNTNYKIVANIPYYITGEIIKKALSEWPQPSKIVLLLQKEVAERIISKDKKESILSISVKIYGEPSIAGIVRAGAFTPAPKVDSAILVIENISKNKLAKIDEKEFFDIVKNGFAHKRKIVSANLKKLLKEKTAELLSKCDIDPKSRAEKIPLQKWICLGKNQKNIS